MGPVLRLIVRARPGDAWEVGLTDGSSKTVWRTVSGQAVRRAVATIDDLLDALPIVALAGHDADRAEAEEAAGRALAIVFEHRDLAVALASILGGSDQRAHPAGLVVDADGASVAGLPWELLAESATGAPLEERGLAVIARLAGGLPGTAPRDLQGTRVRILAWCPTPEDRECGLVLDALRETARRQGCEGPVLLDPVRGRFPPPHPGCVDVLHVVCHGSVVADRGVLVVGEDDQRALGTAAHLLRPGLDSVALVVLDVCQGGCPTADQLASLAQRLVHSGARACVAPREVAYIDAIRCFGRGMHEALARGAPLLEAIASGRSDIRALANPHPDARWCNHVLYLSGLDVARACPVSAGWIPEGWPVGALQVATYLEGARTHAQADALGYLGLQHLALALHDALLDDPVLMRVVKSLPSPGDPCWRELNRGYRRAGASQEPLELTPRLRAYGACLQPGYSLSDLWGLVLADRQHGLNVLAGVDLARECDASVDDHTFRTLAHTMELSGSEDEPPPSAPAVALRVLWGSEDGLLLRPAPGDFMGRWEAQESATLALFQDTTATDRYLSRRHLLWLGPGRVEVPPKKRARHLRGGRASPVSASALELQAGDVLQLTPGSWVMGLGARDLR